MLSTENTQNLAAYDNAPFFERALRVAIERNLLDQDSISAMVNDAATGAIQITEYFAESVHLRHNLELSKNRMVSLVSLYLEQASQGDPFKAAQLIKDKSVRSLSRGGSQMLKALYAMPEDDYFSSPRLGTETEFLKASLSKGLSLAKYSEAYNAGADFKQAIALANYLLKKTGAPLRPFINLHASAQQVVRTCLLSMAYGAKKVSAQPTAFPDETALFAIFTKIRKEWSFLGEVNCSKKFLDELPTEFIAYATQILTSIEANDIPNIVSSTHTLEAVFSELKLRQYFFLYDPLSELSKFDQALSAEWYALTGGSEDDALLLTLMLGVAAGMPAKTVLTPTTAKKMVLAIRAQGLMHKAVSTLIASAPHDEIDQLTALWQDFIEEAQPFLLDKTDEKFEQVLSYLTDRCNIRSAKKTRKS
jgi:hypothetical protein